MCYNLSDVFVNLLNLETILIDTCNFEDQFGYLFSHKYMALVEQAG